MVVARLGDKITIQNTMKDKDGTLVDPSSQLVTLITPFGVYHTSGSSPTKSSTGVYTQAFTVPTTGSQGPWKVMWDATIAGDTKTAVIEVEIIPKDGVDR